MFLASAAALLLEISYTRVISYKLFYYFTYLVIGLALLGLGAGGVAVAVSSRLRRASTDTVNKVAMLVGAAVVVAGYLVVAWLPTNSLNMWTYRASATVEILRVAIVCVAVFATFLPSGIVLATVFSRSPQRINSLYSADLIGAFLACLVAVPLAATIGPPAAIALAAVLLALGGGVAARRGADRRAQSSAAVIAGVLLVAVVAPGVIPDVRLDDGKEALSLSGAPLRYSSWSPLFRVDVRDFGDRRILIHDGLIGSQMLRWDGRIGSLAKFDFEHNVRVLPFATLGRRVSSEAIIGAAAGHEVLASLRFGAAQIDAVELNPVTYRLVTKTMADYNGHVAQQPGVRYVNADGRSYLARSDRRYDLIWYPAPDSYSATNASSASAFVLSESYLYTSDAIADALRHLAPGGIVAAQFGEVSFDGAPNRTLRFLATARAALRQLGVADVRDHLIVSTSPTGKLAPNSTILVKREPFTPGEVAGFTGALQGIAGSRLAWAPATPVPPSKVARAIREQRAAPPAYPYSVGALSDDQPFFWHFAPFTDVLQRITTPVSTTNVELRIGERVMLVLLGLALLLSAAFLLVPFVAVRDEWRRMPHKRLTAAYFCALGFGFMLFEVPLIQRFVLFLGYPTYSLTVTLGALLLSLGLGSLWSARLQPTRRVLTTAAVAVAALGIYYLVGLPRTTSALLDLPLAARIVVAFTVLLPLGLCLGVFMPLGVRTIATDLDIDRVHVAWAWALNGFAAVVGSTSATMLAMTYGFDTVLVLALLLYGVAIATLHRLAVRHGVAAA